MEEKSADEKGEHRPHESQHETHHKVKNDQWKNYIIVALATAVLILGIVFIRDSFTGGSGSSSGSVNAGPAAQAGTQPSAQLAQVEIGDAPVIGSKDAPVTIIEFSDFSCPFCAAASGDNPELVAYMQQRDPTWEPFVTNMMKDYIENGKVRFAVKYMRGHSGGNPAQLVAWCLNEQDLYWKFYPQAFLHQSDVEDLTKMKSLAATIGADAKKLQACLDSKKYDSRFSKEQNEGARAGIQGTPAFLVNGQLISGAVPYSTAKQVIEGALASAS